MTIREQYQPVIDEALRLATAGHLGVTRWDKSPYIEHPKRVAARAEKNFRAIFKDSMSIAALADSIERRAALIYILGLAHDLNEDVEEYRNDRTLFIRQLMAFDTAGIIASHYYDLLQVSLESLNKLNYTSYLEFVLGAKEDILGRHVKQADLEDNLSDLTKGSMKEKYELALYLLAH